MRKCTLRSDNTCVFTRFHCIKNANTQLIWSSASVAVKSRTSTPENSNNGAFLDSDIIIDIVTNASASETSIPRGKKENQYFVIDNDIGASDSSVQAVINDTDNSEKTRPTKKSEKRQNHDHYIMIQATVE